MTPAAARGHAAAPFAPRDHAIGQGARHASRVRNAGLNGVTSDIYAVFFDIPRALCDATLAMQRDAISDLRAWATAPDRRPLVLRGARQVGKTWLVETFAREHIGDVATVNLERHASMHEVFAKPSPRQHLAAIEALLGKHIEPGRCLLFLDEIQALPSLLAQLRYYHEELPALHVVAAGSLLDFELAQHQASMPVGRIAYLHLGPLSFREFAIAVGAGRAIDLVDELALGDTLPQPVHDKLLTTVREYACIGGMPAVVDRYRTTGSLLAAAQVQQDLLATFQDDFARYGTRIPAPRLRRVLDSVARQIGNKFTWSAVARDERAEALRPALDALCRARICRRVLAAHGNGVPFGAEANDKQFKVLLVDTGLAQASLGLLLRATASAEFAHEGPLAEHLVGQMLADLPPRFVEPTLWYWARNQPGAEAEVDYLLQHDTEVVPIEVKAGATGTLRSLLRFVVEKRAQRAVRISSMPPQLASVTANLPGHAPAQFELLSIPFYMVSQLPRLLDSMDRRGASVRERSATSRRKVRRRK